MNAIGRISDFIERVTVYMLIIGVGSLFLSLIVAVFTRYVFQISIIAADEIALYLLAWITFLGASLSVKRNDMVALTFILEKTGSFKWILELLIQVIILLFSLLLLKYGYLWVTAPDTLSNLSTATRVPLWVPYSVFPISMLIIVIFSMNNISNILKEKLKEEL